MVALRIGRQHRREVAAGDAEHGECHGVLQDRKCGREDSDGGEEREGRARCEYQIEALCREGGEIKNTDAAALQCEGVTASDRAPVPAEPEQDERADRDTAQTHLDGKVGMLGKIAQQKGNAEEEDDDAHANDQIAAGEEVPDQPESW
jgi:hypothetical protein